MLQSWKKICVFLSLFVFAAISISAQSNLENIDSEVAKMLLKKDLRLAIKEAESSAANDLSSLLRRLSLYSRIVNNEKIAQTIKQISENPEFEKNRYLISNFVKNAMQSEFFKDAGTLQIYLQKMDFNGDIYSKFSQLCEANKSNCDISGFDKWLAEKVAETEREREKTPDYYQFSGNPNWLYVRIEWRNKFGLDNSVLLNEFIEDVRKNPTDLDAALRYLSFFKSVQDINWLAETFSSEQAYDYYELGESISNQLRYSQINQTERQRIYQITAQFLQKSLSLPFNQKDKNLIWSRKLSHTQVQPILKNPEKQLRFWTKTELAAALKNAGEAQNAQPIVEELMNTDTSDIMSGKPSGLAGQVQMVSGARIVESKILSEQGARQNSYKYWEERVAYYYGRQENERIYDAYKQSFSAVPFDLSNESSRYSRLYFLRRFADFVEDEFDGYDDDEPESLSDQQKAKLAIRLEAESFLRNEFEKTKSNAKYSYELAQIINQNKFEKLSDEILNQNPNLLVNAAKLDLINDIDDLLYVFFKSESISQEKKASVFDQIVKVTENKGINAARILCEALITIEKQPNYKARLVPILVKNLKIAERNFNSSNKFDENYSEVEGLKNKYIEVLFQAYLESNDWKSAEKLLVEKYYFDFYRINYSLEQLSSNAAQNGAFEDAARFWKIKANIDRRNLENLSWLKNYPVVAENLREFYKKMQKDEPFSPIPAKSLEILK